MCCYHLEFHICFQLEYNVTWKKLKDVFKLAGNVLHVEIKKNKEGKSKGIGVVEFEHPMEAVQAICILLFLNVCHYNLIGERKCFVNHSLGICS